MSKNIAIKTISSPLHWIGWVLLSAAIVLVFHFLGVVALYKPWYRALILFVIIAIVDTIKHVIKLQ